MFSPAKLHKTNKQSNLEVGPNRRGHSPHGGSRCARTRSPGRCWGWRCWRGGSDAPNTSCLGHMASRPPRSPDPGHHPALRGRPCRSECHKTTFIVSLHSFWQLPHAALLMCLCLYIIHPSLSISLHRLLIALFLNLPSAAASPAVHESVLVVDGQTGELPLQLTKSWLLGQISAEQQTAQNVSEGDKGGNQRNEFRYSLQYFPSVLCLCSFRFSLWGPSVYSLLVALHPALTTGVWATVSFVCTLRVQLFVAESVSWAWKKKKNRLSLLFWYVLVHFNN